MPEVECSRCGFKWDLISTRKPNTICVSCRAQRVQTVQSVRGKCYPWHGLFAPDMVTPILDSGKPVINGERECGNGDCVNPAHIRKEKNG